MKHYSVEWVIDIDAKDAVSAAEEAWRLMRGHGSTANCFTVTDDEGNGTEVDLEDVWAHLEDRYGSTN